MSFIRASLFVVAVLAATPAVPADPILLHFHGNTHDKGADETPCTGNGAADVLGCKGPFLRPSAVLDSAPAARWEINSAALSNNVERSTIDPNWIWNLAAPVTVSGLTTIRWWAACNATCTALGGEWNISLWADGVRVFGPFQVTATPEDAEVPSRVTAALTLPEITASKSIVLVIDAFFADTGQGARFYYDSTLACPGAAAGPCDSTIIFNDIPPPPPGPESVCETPGLTILQDATGDATDQFASHDVQKLSISQPYFANGDYKLYFHLKMASLSPLPENTLWPVNFCAPAFPCTDPMTAYGATNKYYTVRMSTASPASAAAPVFQILKPTAAGTTAASRTIVAAEPAPESGYTADGLITIAVRASELGLAPAGAGTDQIKTFQVRIGSNVPNVGSVTPDNMPDSLAGAGEFNTTTLTECRPNILPLASLVADVQEGNPPPLSVTFTVSGSDADGDALDSFTLDFGDGQTLANQGFNGQVSALVTHPYQDAGNFTAGLVVTDARAGVSNNTAEVSIRVTGPPIAVAGANFTAVEGASAELNGGDSTDGNNGALTYQWTQQTGPTVLLTGANTSTASFTAPAVCKTMPDYLRFRLTVNNAGGVSFDDVAVTVNNINSTPVAQAGMDFSVDAGSAVMLSAAGSSDADCEALTYAWSQVAGPQATLSNPSTATPAFTAPTVSTAGSVLRFRLAVSDPSGASSTDDVLVSVRHVPTPLGVTQVGALPCLSSLMLGLLGLLSLRRRRLN